MTRSIQVDAVPEVLPDREELVRAEVAAYWMSTGDRGYSSSGPVRIELCTRALQLPGAAYEARDGHRLRISVARYTRKIGVTEEPDTGTVFVWNHFSPHALAARHLDRLATMFDDATPVEVSPSMTMTLPTVTDAGHWETRGAALQVQADRLSSAETVLRTLVVTVSAGLPPASGERFLDQVEDLPAILDNLGCWDLFYGRARLDAGLIASAAASLGLGGAELALVGAIGGLARGCDEATLRCAVGAVASLDVWLSDRREEAR